MIDPMLFPIGSGLAVPYHCQSIALGVRIGRAGLSVIRFTDSRHERFEYEYRGFVYPRRNLARGCLTQPPPTPLSPIDTPDSACWTFRPQQHQARLVRSLPSPMHEELPSQVGMHT